MKNFKTTRKIKIAFCVFVLVLPALAMAGSCFDLAKQYGKGRSPGDQTISPACIQKAMDSAGRNARSLSESGAIQVFGFANVLVVRQFNPFVERTIAGPSTEFQNIVATAIDEWNHEVFVYDDVRKSVFVFTATMGGNLAPKRTLKLDGLNGVVGLAIDSKRDELFVALEKEVAVFSRLANADGKRRENSQAELRRITGPQTGLSRISAMTLNAQDERLFISDSEKNSVFVFETQSKGDTPPLRELKGVKLR